MWSRSAGLVRDWPAGMVISVDPRPAALLELLYVREIRGLDADAEGVLPLGFAVPRGLPDVVASPSAPRSSPDAGQWVAAWQDAWDAYADGSAYGIPDDRTSTAPLPGFPPRAWLDPAERRAFTQWQRALVNDWVATTPGRRGPERLAVAALTTAWRTGIEKVLVLPSDQPFATRLSRAVAALSSATRLDPSAYPEALTRIAALAA